MLRQAVSSAADLNHFERGAGKVLRIENGRSGPLWGGAYVGFRLSVLRKLLQGEPISPTAVQISPAAVVQCREREGQAWVLLQVLFPALPEREQGLGKRPRTSSGEAGPVQ